MRHTPTAARRDWPEGLETVPVAPFPGVEVVVGGCRELKRVREATRWRLELGGIGWERAEDAWLCGMSQPVRSLRPA